MLTPAMTETMIKSMTAINEQVMANPLSVKIATTGIVFMVMAGCVWFYLKIKSARVKD